MDRGITLLGLIFDSSSILTSRCVSCGCTVCVPLRLSFGSASGTLPLPADIVSPQTRGPGSAGIKHHLHGPIPIATTTFLGCLTLLELRLEDVAPGDFGQGATITQCIHPAHNKAPCMAKRTLDDFSRYRTFRAAAAGTDCPRALRGSRVAIWRSDCCDYTPSTSSRYVR